MLELILSEIRKVSDKVDGLEKRMDNLESKVSEMEISIKNNFSETQNQVVKLVDVLGNEDRKNKEIFKSLLYDVAVLKTRI